MAAPEWITVGRRAARVLNILPPAWSAQNIASDFFIFWFVAPVTVAERSEACTVFARSEPGIMGSNPTQDMDVWYVYMFILCLCCPVFR
jgi:hypothetical protein